MSLFSPNEIRFRIIDINPDSIESAKAIIETLGLDDHLLGFETIDAGNYRIPPDEQPDIIIMEIMQNCLMKEPQVAVTRRLLEQAPNAALIPEEILIELVLVDSSRELNLEITEQERETIRKERIHVGTVFTLNSESVALWKDDASRRLPASRLLLPATIPAGYQPMLATLIRTYGSHMLQNLESGLTIPRPLSTTGSFAQGDTIQFHYQTGNNPRLECEVIPNP
jgi:hypothetical protein